MVDYRVPFKIIAEGDFYENHQQLKSGTTAINDFDTLSTKKIIYRTNTKFITGRKAISLCKTGKKLHATNKFCQ